MAAPLAMAAFGAQIGSTLGGAVASIGGGIAQSIAMRTQVEYAKNQLELNKQLTSFYSQDAIRRGHQDAMAILAAGKRLQSSQKSAQAANNIDVDSASAKQTRADAQFITELDAIQARQNAWLEAMGHDLRAQRLEGQFGEIKIAGQNRARMSIVNGIAGGVSSITGGLSNIVSAGKDAGVF